MNVNIKNGGFRVSGGIASASIAVCFDNTSYEFFFTPSKAGFTIAYDVNYRNLMAEEYIQYYFRSVPTLCTAVVMCCIPQTIYMVASYFFESVYCSYS